MLTGTAIILENRDTYDNDAFIFSTGQVVPDDGTIPWDGPADMAVKASSIYLSSFNVMGGLADLGEGTTLAATTSVPEFDYMPIWHVSSGYGIALGHVYALRLADGRYAAIEFTEITTGPGATQCTFNYKYQTNGTPILQ